MFPHVLACVGNLEKHVPKSILFFEYQYLMLCSVDDAGFPVIESDFAAYVLAHLLSLVFFIPSQLPVLL